MILAGTVAGNLTVWKKVALAGAAVVAIALPVFVGGLRAQTAVPKFDVSSVRVCDAGAPGRGRGGRGGGSGMGGPTSPDRISLNCVAVQALIRTAYVNFAGGHYKSLMTTGAVPVEGIPKWAESERYTINATAESKPGQEMMRGPMLQALLEERFQLKIRRETRDIPVFDMTVAKNGLKLKPVPEGSCTPLETTFPPMPPTATDGDKSPCGAARLDDNGRNVMIDMAAASLDDLVRTMGFFADRPIVNKTGLVGLFAVKMEFERMGGVDRIIAGHVGTPASADSSDTPPGPSIFAAMQGVGLKLEAAKGPRDFLVIEKLEKPTEN